MIIRDDDYLRLNLLSDFIEDFVVASHRQRLYYLLSRPKRRSEIISYFSSDSYLDERRLCAIPRDDQNPDAIYAIMKQRGAIPPCFALSFHEVGLQEVDLKQALKECVGYGKTTILYSPKNKVAYWEGHCQSGRWILSRDKS